MWDLGIRKSYLSISKIFSWPFLENLTSSEGDHRPDAMASVIAQLHLR